MTEREREGANAQVELCNDMATGVLGGLVLLERMEVGRCEAEGIWAGGG